MIRVELDPSLREAVQVGTPLEIFDPATNQSFFLLSLDQFRALEVGASSDMDLRELYPSIEKIMAEDDANDPWLETYQCPGYRTALRCNA